MPDNILLNAPTIVGGQTVATDDIGGVQHELVKIEFGTDGNATMVSTGNPLPVIDAAAEAALASIAAEDFATHAAQTDGSQKSQIVDGSGNVISATSNALDVNIKSGGGGAVTIADGADVAEGATTDAAVVTDANGTVSGKLRGLVKLLSSWIGTLGQKTMANSAPITIASDQSAIPINGVVPGTAATNLGKAEDAPHTTGDVGVMALAVRNDAGAALAGNDGDYVPVTTDATGALRIDMNGTVSTNNSSTAILLAAAVFTGTSEDVLNYNEIRITVYSDVASATNGLSIQQSTDNSNWVVTDTYSIAAATGKTFSVPRQARYFRIIYTNGASNQAIFILQTILNRVGTKSSSQRPGDAYTNETDLEQQQSFPMGYDNTTGLWNRLRSTTAFGLEVDIKRSAGSVTDNTQLYSNNIVAAGAITGIDTTGYASIIFQLSGAWSAEIIVEGSNDNATWNGLLVMNINELSMIDTVQSNGIFAFKTTSKFIRLNVIGFNVGTITALILGRTVLGINGADVLSLAMDKSNNTPLYVSEVDTNKDINKSFIPSDAPVFITGSASVSVPYVIDTLGYQSVSIQFVSTTVGGANISISASNDKSTWSVVNIPNANSTQFPSVSTNATGTTFTIPASGRFIRINTNSGNAFFNAYLRQQPSFGNNNLNSNIVGLNGTAPVTGGVAGILAIGGNIAVGSAPTANPIPLAIDSSGLTRRILTDTSGRLINSIDQTGTSRVSGSLSPGSNIYNIPSTAVQDVSQFEGQSQIEIIGQILLELKIMNQYMSELPAILQLPNGKFDEPSTFRNDTSVFAN